MFNFEEFFNKRKIQYLIKKENKEKIIEYLLHCPNIKEAIQYLDTKYLHDLDLEFYELPVEGYINLYDYLINTRNTVIHPKEECYKSRSIYIPILLKFKSTTQLSRHITTEMLLDKMPNNQTVLEYIIENDEFFDLSDGFTVDSLEVAKILIEKNKISMLENATMDILFSQIGDNKTVLDLLKENNIIPRVQYIKKPGLHEFDMSTRPKANILLERHNDKTLLEILLEKDFDFVLQLNEYCDNHEDWKKIVKALLRSDNFKPLKNAPQDFLSLVINHNEEKNKDIKVIDILRKDELPELIGIVDNKDVLLRYISTGKITELLHVITEEGLLLEIDKNFTILDYLICKCVELKIDLIEFIKVLRMRKEITSDISVIFAKYGIYIPSEYKKQTGIKSDSDMYHYIYDDNNYEVDKEGLRLINEFKSHFDENENSKDLIETVIKSFKRTYQDNKDLAIRDLKILIEFKKKYPKFILEYNPSKGSSFTKPTEFTMFENTPKISLQNKYNLDTFHHELGHLVSYFATGKQTPSNIKTYLDKENYNGLTRVAEIFEVINNEAEELLLSDEEYDKKFTEFIINKYQSVENYKRIIREDFKKFIGTKDLILEAINDGSYSDEVLKAIVESYFEIEEMDIDQETLIEMYTKTRIDSEKKIFKDELYRKSNMEFLCYENFIDAFYTGDLYEYFKIMASEQRITIKAPLCTHNSMYFIMNEEAQFQELYANYIELKKSPKGSYYIEKLKEKTTEEIIELLEEYDKSLTIALQNNKKDRSK